ncbi:MAG: DUF192 domain-containing protein [Gemmatimonadota bacterium]
MTAHIMTRRGRPVRSHLWVLALGLIPFAIGCLATDEPAANNGQEPPASDAQGQVSGTPERSMGVAPSPAAGHAWVIFGADTVVAEVAATADQRADGLMYREEVPDGTGMLFVFQDNEVRAFWMANTYVPLDIAYMDPSYRIVDIVQMEPLVTDTYPSSAPAMFALEVRQGWFAEEGIGVGDQAEVVFGVGAGR